MLDLDYEEDSAAETDANFVMTGAGSLVEVQATAEAAVFTDAQLQDLLALAKTGIAKLVELQKTRGRLSSLSGRSDQVPPLRLRLI